MDADDNQLEQHRCIIHYTIGRCKGLDISAGYPIYVCGIDVVQKCVILGKNGDLFSDSLIAQDITLISVENNVSPVRVCAKIRYQHKEQPATAWMQDGLLHAQFNGSQCTITKGQAVVLYDGETVIGGATIC